MTPDPKFWKGLALGIVLSLALWAFIFFSLNFVTDLMRGA